MIKFIACDIDGTMLRNGEKAISERLYNNIKRIADMGIIFAPASGRQYPTMKKMFGSIREELLYICENGALVNYKGKVLSESVMDLDTVKCIARDIYSMPNCEVLMSGKDISYMKPKTRGYFERIHDKIKNNIYIVNDFDKIEDDIIKIACCDLSGIENSKDHFSANWSDKVQTAVSGDLYFDFTCMGVNKGNAITQVLDMLGIKKEETIAFGDSFNDIEMFKSVGKAYVMDTASEDVKAEADTVINDVNDVLERIIGGNYE